MMEQNEVSPYWPTIVQNAIFLSSYRPERPFSIPNVITLIFHASITEYIDAPGRQSLVRNRAH